MAVEGAVTEWDSAPASDQEAKVFSVPPEVCGEVVAMVWLEPIDQVKVCVLV